MTPNAGAIYVRCCSPGTIGVIAHDKLIPICRRWKGSAVCALVFTLNSARKSRLVRIAMMDGDGDEQFDERERRLDFGFQVSRRLVELSCFGHSASPLPPPVTV